jgi:hypothetical protein
MRGAKARNAKEVLGEMKVPIGLYPNVARIETCLVFQQSARQYGAYNWRNQPVRISIYLDAIDRHTIALRAGEDIDESSGRPHAAHINACTAIIMEAKELGILVDDRFEKDMSAHLLKELTSSTYRATCRKLKPRPARRLNQIDRI